MASTRRLQRFLLPLLGLATVAALFWLFFLRGTGVLRFENATLENFTLAPDMDAYGLRSYMLNGVLIVPSLHPRTDTQDKSITISFDGTQKTPSIAERRFPTTDIHLDLYSKEPAQMLHLTFLTHSSSLVSYSYEKDLMLRTGDQPDANGLYRASTVLETDVSTAALLLTSDLNHGYLRLILAFKKTPDSTETMTRYYDFKTHLPSR